MKIEIIKIKNNTQLNEVVSLLNIFSNDDFIKLIPTKIIKNEIISEEMYSYLPWPKGCSLSGGLRENLNAIKFIIDEAESDRLLKASAVIETLFKINPIINFIINKIKFKNILM